MPYLHLLIGVWGQRFVKRENVIDSVNLAYEELPEKLLFPFSLSLVGQLGIQVTVEERKKKPNLTDQKEKNKRNKAGYTATSCGRVGRGGNARFPTFRLDHLYGPTNQPTNQPTDGRTDGQSLL